MGGRRPCPEHQVAQMDLRQAGGRRERLEPDGQSRRDRRRAERGRGQRRAPPGGGGRRGARGGGGFGAGRRRRVLGGGAGGGGAAHPGNPPLNGTPPYRHPSGLGYSGAALMAADAVAFSGTPVAGNTIPATIGATPGGSRADVEARHGYNSLTHRWTVEFRRRRGTGQGEVRTLPAGGGGRA